jgi:regulatory protein
MEKHQPRPPARMSEDTLADAAVTYLSRYASSTGNLRRVLTRKVRLSAAYHGDDPEPLLAFVETLVSRHAAAGAVDDRQYAASQTRKLRRRGASTRILLQHLGAKGVPRDVIAEAADSAASRADDGPAAVRFARRRRLGPFRAADRPEHRLFDLAAMGRAGFGYALAVSVIDAPDGDALDAPPGES